MKKIIESKGLTPMLREFRDIIKNNNCKKVVFVGSRGVCLPFVELCAYTVRDLEELYFIPDVDLENAKKLILKDVGMQCGETARFDDVDAVVLFGGLAMPKIGVDVEEVKDLLDRLNPKLVVGVCFMSVFQKSGWIEEIEFDYLIDGSIKVEVFKR
ncbi:DUF2124 domain-containing protein [Methanotorris formicicus]|uniref:Uncharacterized conserved protein UCP004962 n=1 Tax=Methanotorris formicicus Mc-S-70 TaxID=647171 RepID=H1L1Q7_9EURY|nr:DUF2124 domain-containing protein [Methanotorris formicicus]EHP83389.1 Uncharacterized conserved protein UCP004962 [Methanotorris formicicus Mc-S-70]